MIMKNCDINQKNLCGQSALHIACLENETSFIKQFLQLKHCDLNSQDLVGHTALIDLILTMGKKSLPLIKLLLKSKKVDVNLQDLQGNSALIHACTKGYFFIAQYLIRSKKCNLNLNNHQNQTAFLLSCARKYKNITQEFVYASYVQHIDLQNVFLFEMFGPLECSLRFQCFAAAISCVEYGLIKNSENAHEFIQENKTFLLHEIENRFHKIEDFNLILNHTKFSESISKLIWNFMYYPWGKNSIKNFMKFCERF